MTLNDPALTERMLPTLRRAAGADNVRVGPLPARPKISRFFSRRCRGCSCSSASRRAIRIYTKAPQNHSPLFFADESALPIGVKVMTNLALDYSVRQAPVGQRPIPLDRTTQSARK